MKNKTCKYVISSLLLLIVVLSLWQQCSDPPHSSGGQTSHINTVYVTSIQYDTVEIKSIVYVPTPPEIVYVEIPQEVDTTEALKDYYTHKYSEEVLKDDTVAYIMLKDSLYMNQIASRQWVYKNRVPTAIYQTTEIYNNIPKWQLGVGAETYFGLNAFDVGFGLDLQLQNKWQYEALYFPFSQRISLGVKYHFLHSRK